MDNIDKITVYKLVNLKRDKESGRLKAPISFTIPTKDVIIVNGKEVPIKYSPGTVTNKDGNMVDIVSQIDFRNGHLIVKPHEKSLNDFLKKTNWNKSNPGRIEDKVPLFELVDEGKDKEEAMVALDVKWEAATIVRNWDHEEQMAAALALKINTTQPAAAIQHDLLLYAETQPDWFSNNQIDQIKIKAKFFKAIELGLVKMDRNARSFSWADERGLIARTPVGIDNMIDWFIDWAADNEENGVFDEIIHRVNEDLGIKEEKHERLQKVLSPEVKETEVPENQGQEQEQGPEATKKEKETVVPIGAEG